MEGVHGKLVSDCAALVGVDGSGEHSQEVPARLHGDEDLGQLPIEQLLVEEVEHLLMGIEVLWSRLHRELQVLDVQHTSVSWMYNTRF